MFRILFLFAFIGAGALAGSSLQETYHYNGVISAGILNPREAAAGSSVDMIVVVKRDSTWKAQVQFKDAKIIEINTLNFEKTLYGSSGIWRKASDLEGTVTAYLSRDTGTVMEVPNSQKHWVTEIQKSIINILRIPPYLGRSLGVDLYGNQIRKVSAKDRPSFYETEETFAGRCNVSYTMTPISGTGVHEAAPQGSYRLLRSIDFDSCHLPVQLIKSSHGNYSHVHQSQFKEVQTRSAVTSYILRPRHSEPGYDVLNVTQHGHQITKPFGQDTGRLVVKSNQTLSLLQVKEASEFSSVSSTVMPITSWQYQFVSPAAPKSGSKVPWVIYKSKGAMYPIYPEYVIMGEEQDFTQVVKRVKTMLNEMTLLQLQDVQDHNLPYNGTTDGRVTEMMNTLAKTIRGLTYNNIKSLYEFTRTQRSTEDRVRRQCFLDASIASGSSGALRALIEEYKSGHIDYIRMAGLVTLYTNNVFDPESIPMLMDFVKTLSLSRDGFYLPMMANLNFARLAHRVCIHPNTKLYSVPHHILGSKMCDANHIRDGYVKFLTDIIARTSSIYEHIVYLQSLASLGIDSTIPQIKEYIVGHAYENRSLTFRLAAIYALDVNFPERHQREKVIDILLPVAEDHSQMTVLREAAFMTIMSAKPNETILHRFALGTWREPSYQMRSMVSSTFVSLAMSDAHEYDVLSKTASNLIGRMRLVEPSMSNSLYFVTKTRLPDYEIDVRNGMGWLNEYTRPYVQNRRNLQSLEVEFGGINVPILEVFSLSTSLNGRRSNLNSRNPAHRQVLSQMMEYKDDIEEEARSSSVNIYTYINGFNFQSIFGNSLVKTEAFMENVNSWMTNSLAKAPVPFLPNQTVKYFNPVDIVSILPTPFGTPAIVEVTTPNNWMWNFNYTMTLVKGAWNVTMDGNNKMTMKTQSYVSLLMPWCNVTATAGIDTESTVSVPGKFSVLQQSSYPYTLMKTNISPRFRGERPVVYFRNKPLTALRPIGPLSDLTTVNNLLTVKSKPSNPYRMNVEVPKDVLGLKSRLVYEGEVQQPFQQSVFMDVVQNPKKLVTLLTTPTAKDISLSYRLNIDSSETKNISVAAIIDVAHLTGLKVHVPKKESAPKSGEELAQKLSLSLSPEEMMQKTKEGELGDFLLSLSANYTTPNVRTRQYQLVYSGINQTSFRHAGARESLVFNLMKKGMVNAKDEQKTCFVTDMSENTQPKRSESEGTPIPYTFMTSSVYAGHNCVSSEKIGLLQSTWYLSQDKTLCSSSGLTCSMDDQSHSRMPWRIHPVYTRMDFDLRATKTPFPRYFQNMTYWFSDMAVGFAFPSPVQNYVGAKDIPVNHMTINITRHNASDVVDSWVRTSSQITRVQSYPVIPLFDWSTPLLGTTPPFSTHSRFQSSGPVRAPMPSDRCSLDSRRVNTFDGVVYNRLASECWEIVAQVFRLQESFTVFMRRPSKESNEVEVKLQMPGIRDILIKGSEVTAGGQPVPNQFAILNDKSEEIGSIQKSPSVVNVYVFHYFSLNIRAESFELKFTDKLKGFVRGACGDFNGETSGDLRTPKGCILTRKEGNVFAASWIDNRESCHDPQVREFISKASEIETSKCRETISWNRRF